MDLLERGEQSAVLGEAGASAAKGKGWVVLVTGEPGIGKTALVSRFVADFGNRARVLWGTCDDLSIPRPLAPLADLAGEVSYALRVALTTGAPRARVHDLMLAELSAAPRPTVLVLEDVHWADEATLDTITVIGRRIASLPAVLVLTFRQGEVSPADPLWASLGSFPGERSRHLPLGPLPGGRGLSRRSRQGTGVRTDGGQPLLCDRAAGLPLG